MSHQDKKSKECIVVNHKSLKQAIDVLFPARVFRGIKMRRGSRWSARMLAVVALLWAWSGLPTLGERFVDACKVARKAFRWLPGTGETYQGFMKQLRKWHFDLKVLGMGELRARDAARLVRAMEDCGVRDHRGGWQPSRVAPHRVE